jgi:hypothetical protein
MTHIVVRKHTQAALPWMISGGRFWHLMTEAASQSHAPIVSPTKTKQGITTPMAMSMFPHDEAAAILLFRARGRLSAGHGFVLRSMANQLLWSAIPGPMSRSPSVRARLSVCPAERNRGGGIGHTRAPAGRL